MSCCDSLKARRRCLRYTVVQGDKGQPEKDHCGALSCAPHSVRREEAEARVSYGQARGSCGQARGSCSQARGRRRNSCRGGLLEGGRRLGLVLGTGRNIGCRRRRRQRGHGRRRRRSERCRATSGGPGQRHCGGGDERGRVRDVAHSDVGGAWTAAMPRVHKCGGGVSRGRGGPGVRRGRRGAGE